MHVGIANPWWRGKRSRHSRCMRNPQLYISGKRPMAVQGVRSNQTPYHSLLIFTWLFLLQATRDQHFHPACHSSRITYTEWLRSISLSIGSSFISKIKLKAHHNIAFWTRYYQRCTPQWLNILPNTSHVNFLVNKCHGYHNQSPAKGFNDSYQNKEWI